VAASAAATTLVTLLGIGRMAVSFLGGSGATRR
jgi:hypothetical protein